MKITTALVLAITALVAGNLAGASTFNETPLRPIPAGHGNAQTVGRADIAGTNRGFFVNSNFPLFFEKDLKPE